MRTCRSNEGLYYGRRYDSSVSASVGGSVREDSSPGPCVQQRQLLRGFAGSCRDVITTPACPTTYARGYETPEHLGK